MYTLTPRLTAIAEYIEPGETLADVGTDHGALPVFLCREEICPSGIMTDISAESLAKARFAGADLIEEGILSARVGDGLEPLEKGEADNVVMAGLGGNLMIEILEKDPEKSLSFSCYILQPRKAAGRLRRYLYEKGYRITAERLVRERRHLCEIIKVRSPGAEEEGLLLPEEAERLLTEAGPDDIRWEVPPYYGRLDDPLMDEYLKEKEAREERNLANRNKAKVRDEAAVAETTANLAYIRELMEERR